MMPGSKKLEIGGETHSGWFTLRHHERSLFKCNVCTRNDNQLFLLPDEKEKMIKC
jgi:hypothetical protein